MTWEWFTTGATALDVALSLECIPVRVALGGGH